MSPESELAARAVTLNTRPDITHVKAILNDGREITLSQRPLGNTGQPSQCTFFGELADGSFRITLRLDWSKKAMDANGDPTLDADVTENGKKYCIDRMNWHHTPKGVENGE